MVDVVYVEDDTDQLAIFGRAMQYYQPAIRYKTYGSGRQFLGWLQANEPKSAEYPKLLVLDLNLGDMTAYDILQQLRQEADTRQIPVVVYSSSDNPADMEQAYLVGANAYVVKPDSYQNTGQILQRMLAFWLF